MQLDISSSSDYTVSIVNFIVVLNVTENKFYINLMNLVSLMCIHYDFVNIIVWLVIRSRQQLIFVTIT